MPFPKLANAPGGFLKLVKEGEEMKDEEFEAVICKQETLRAVGELLWARGYSKRRGELIIPIEAVFSLIKGEMPEEVRGKVP